MGREETSASAGDGNGHGEASLALRGGPERTGLTRLRKAFERTDPLMWHNTTRGLRLFVRAAFDGVAAGRRAKGADDRVACALFTFGAIATAAELGRLTEFARRRCEIGFLRRAYGAGLWHAQSLRWQLYRRAEEPRGRLAVGEGRLAVVAWLRGEDPGQKLRDLVDRLPGDRIPTRSLAPFRRVPTLARVPLRARR